MWSLSCKIISLTIYNYFIISLSRPKKKYIRRWKIVSPRIFFRSFLSNRFEFHSEILQTYLVIPAVLFAVPCSIVQYMQHFPLMGFMPVFANTLLTDNKNCATLEFLIFSYVWFCPTSHTVPIVRPRCHLFHFSLVWIILGLRHCIVLELISWKK